MHAVAAQHVVLVAGIDEEVGIRTCVHTGFHERQGVLGHASVVVVVVDNHQVAFEVGSQILQVALLVAIPIGVGGAIYLAEYAKRNSPLVRTIRLTAETLQGIPSIIYGLFGMVFFTALRINLTLLSGALTLSLMVLPLILRTTEEALLSIPDSYREGSFALGAGALSVSSELTISPAMSVENVRSL